MKEEDKTELLVAVERVETEVVSLRGSFDQKIREDEARFQGIENELAQNTRMLAQHATLHTQHASMISEAQNLALKAFKASQEARDNQESAIRTAVGNLAVSNAKEFASVRADNKLIKDGMSVLSKWSKHPLFKIAYVLTGVAIAILAHWFAK